MGAGHAAHGVLQALRPERHQKGCLDTTDSGEGTGLFGTDKENIEGPVNCHGCAWGDSRLSADHVYRGDLLFYVSMYGHLTQQGICVPFPGVPYALVPRM